MRKYLLGMGLIILGSSCATKSENSVKETSEAEASEPVQIKAKPDRDLLLSVQNGDKVTDIIKITPKGEIFHRGNQITRPDEIVASFYDMVLAPDYALQKCRKSLSFYRENQVTSLMSQVAKAEEKAIAERDAAKAKAEKAKEKSEKKPKKP